LFAEMEKSGRKCRELAVERREKRKTDDLQGDVRRGGTRGG